MNRYLKLVNFEINRFRKIYLALIVITLLAQIIGIIVKSNQYNHDVSQYMQDHFASSADYIQANGPVSLIEMMNSLWFLGPIALCIAILIFYTFLIWYRDWFGKNTFAYRLFMLPTSRLTIYFSKASAIFVMVLGLIGLQLMLFPLIKTIFKWMISSEFRNDQSLIEMIKGLQYINILIPQTFTEFILYYGAGFMVMTVLFTAILFERSFRYKGIAIAIIYCVASGFLFLSPVIFEAINSIGQFLYPIEILMMEIGLGIVITGYSIWISHYLLQKKITV
jgi:hypothetical protein